MNLSKREKELLDLSTIGGLSIEEAFFKAYRVSSKKVGMTSLRKKEKSDPELFLRIRLYKMNLEKEIEKIKSKEFLKEAKEKIASEIELDAILSQIALGTFIKKKIIAKFNSITGKPETFSIDELPTHADQIDAIDKLYKRKGSYDPPSIKVKHDVNDTFLKLLMRTSGIDQERKGPDPDV